MLDLTIFNLKKIYIKVIIINKNYNLFINNTKSTEDAVNVILMFNIDVDKININECLHIILTIISKFIMFHHS